LLESDAGPKIQEALKDLEHFWGKCPEDIDLSLINGFIVFGMNVTNEGYTSVKGITKSLGKPHGIHFYLDAEQLRF
jgi:hypothetical protein